MIDLTKKQKPCKCGCGEIPKRGKFLPGHVFRYKKAKKEDRLRRKKEKEETLKHEEEKAKKPKEYAEWEKAERRVKEKAEEIRETIASIEDPIKPKRFERISTRIPPTLSIREFSIKIKELTSSALNYLYTLLCKAVGTFNLRREQDKLQIRIETEKTVEKELEVALNNLSLKATEVKESINAIPIPEMQRELIASYQRQAETRERYVAVLQDKNTKLITELKITQNKVLLLRASTGEISMDIAMKESKPIYITREAEKAAENFPYAEVDKRFIKVLLSTRPITIDDLAFQAQSSDASAKKFIKMIVKNDNFILDNDAMKWRLVWYNEGGIDKITYLLVMEGEHLHPNAFKIPADNLA